ncbi:MAG: hypothetical protein EOP48_05270 [Sphingobacteriales bacterium]|nr:MAG: hypothetical protein EOP48_05270 [Sphingobacteriales bacterium]
MQDRINIRNATAGDNVNISRSNGNLTVSSTSGSATVSDTARNRAAVESVGYGGAKQASNYDHYKANVSEMRKK